MPHPCNPSTGPLHAFLYPPHQVSHRQDGKLCEFKWHRTRLYDQVRCADGVLRSAMLCCAVLCSVGAE